MRIERLADGVELYLGDKRKRVGAEHPLYRGGKRVDPQGYVVLTSKAWGKDCGRREHQVVMERKLGRPMTRGEVVHHINGVKTDNHPDNLELHTRSSHVRAHGTGGLRKCHGCGAEKWYSPSVNRRLAANYLCRPCYLATRGME